jgi:hypothetical protein
MRDRPTSVACGLSTFANLLSFCDKNAAAIVQAGAVREIRQAREQGKIAHLSGWQSALPLLDDANGELVVGRLRTSSARAQDRRSWPLATHRLRQREFTQTNFS